MYIYKLSQEEFDSINKALSASLDVEYHHIEVGDQYFEYNTKTLIPSAVKGLPSWNKGLFGDKSPRWGKKHSNLTKEKISLKQKGKIISEETRKKMSESQKGKIFTEETKKKISNSKIGKTSGMKGKKKITTICPHCSRIGARSLLKRYHFDNCKSLQSRHHNT